MQAMLNTQEIYTLWVPGHESLTGEKVEKFA